MCDEKSRSETEDEMHLDGPMDVSGLDDHAPHLASPRLNANENRQNILWLASYPKSGSTWVRVFLHNLARESRGETEGAQDINALNELVGWESFKLSFGKKLGKPAEAATPREIAEARYAVQKDMAAAAGGSRIVKTHSAVANLDGFPTINFDVTRAAVYLVRNPLDVTVSYAHYSGLPYEPIIEHMASGDRIVGASFSRVFEYLSSWSFHVASWLSVPNRPVLILRYEDLLASPEKHFRRLTNFLRLRPSPEQLRAAIARSSFAELAAQEAAAGYVEKPAQAEKFFRAGRAGQWKEALSPEQIRAVAEAHAPMMMRCGYLAETSGE